MRIEDKLPGGAPRTEELRYDSVVSVNPGTYRVALFDQKTGKKLAKRGGAQALDGGTERALVAAPHESYVILRIGVEAQQGDSFPEEIVVFPEPGLLSVRPVAVDGRRDRRTTSTGRTGTDGQRKDDGDGTDDGTDGRAEDDDGDDGMDTMGRTDGIYIYIFI